jgi:hypothetical protein
VSDVIDFLERLGQDADLRSANTDEIEAALLNAGIEPGLRQAILGDDRRALEALLGADGNVCCVVFKEDEEEEEEEGEEEEEEEEGEDDEKSLLEESPLAHRRVARSA